MQVSILVVDDNNSIRKALRLYFNSCSDCCVCGESADGVEAIEATRRLKPDLVVLDLVMPKLNGLETAKAIRSVSPDLPVIMFTSHISSALEKQAHAAGIRVVLSKTDGLDLLLKEIRKLSARNRNGNGNAREAHGGI
ncbi:MAG: response regulator transcription factor [Candidatus Acidiferrales bacterium]